jgi:hypothetical protein
MAEREVPRCAACRRPLSVFPEAARRVRAVPQPGEPVHGKFVCTSALCNRYGLVVRIDPPPERREA